MLASVSVKVPARGFARPLVSSVSMLTFLSRMLDVEDDNLLRICIKRVVDEICIFPGDDLRTPSAL